MGRYIRVYPVSGDGKYSVSEVQIFNDSLEAGCPFDANANAIALGSAQCSYSGTITTDAALPSGTPLKLHLSGAPHAEHGSSGTHGCCSGFGLDGDEHVNVSSSGAAGVHSMRASAPFGFG